MTTLIACSRLYDVTRSKACAWHEILEETGRLAGVRLRILNWAAPADLGALWKRPDLGLTFLCGRPYLQAGARHQIIGAPLGPESGAEAAYCTLLLARSSSRWSRVEDSFGSRLGHMPVHSQSGYNALRFLLASYARGGRLYASHTAFETPVECLNALCEGRVDVIPLDSYFHSLLTSCSSRWQDELSILGRSPLTAMPFLAASPGLDSGVVTALRGALEAWSRSSCGEELRRELCMKGFSLPIPSDYAVLAEQEAAALRLSYPCPR